MQKPGLIKNMSLALGLSVLTGVQAPNVHAAFKYWDVTAPDSMKLTPATLSATGLYTNIAAAQKVMLTNVYHFEVNSPLWSDGAHKLRWVMNKPGTSITYSEKDDYWGYPDSAIFIKQFAIDTVPGDTTTRLLWETRFLINRKEAPDPKIPTVKKDHWYGYSYKWDRNNKEARLIGTRGADDSIKVFPNGKSKPGVMKKWRFPSREQCAQCHRVDYSDEMHGRSVLGFFTAQLNRPHPDVANINQLEYFFNQGVLKGTKSNWAAKSTPRWYGIDDSSATVDLRVRSYIAANCSGCHGTRGMATGATFGVDLNYDFQTMESQMEFRHHSVSWPFGLDDSTVQPLYYPKTDLGNNPRGLDSLFIDPALVVPGYPQKSVILFRQLQRKTVPGDYDSDKNQMPPIASYEVNVPATNLIKAWIKDMPKIPAPLALGVRTWSVRTNLKGPGIQGNMVVLPMDLAGVPGKITVSLTGITGRTQQLRQVSRTAYALPGQMAPGIYIIKVNSKAFTRYLF